MINDKILNLLKSGKTDRAFVMLYKEFPKFKGYVINQGGKKEQAEDIFQEALLVLFKKVNTADFELTNTLNTYLFNTAKYMWWRVNKEKRKTELSLDLPFTDEQELEEAILKETKLLKAEKALLILGEKCKQILEAFYYK